MYKHTKCRYYFPNVFSQIKTQTWCFQIYSLWSWNMRWAFTRTSETVKQHVLFLCLCMIFARRGSHTLIGCGKSPFHPRSRCFVSAWVLDLRSICENLHQFLSCLFLTLDETISYWILCSLRSTSYKIIVPPTHNWLSDGIPKWPKTLKTLSFLICYHPSTRQPARKVQSFGLEGWGYSEGG